MDKVSPDYLPLRILVILSICVCSLVMHFVAESLGPVAWSAAFEILEDRGDFDSDHDDTEDDFALPDLVNPGHSNAFTRMVLQADMTFLSFFSPPIFPLPKQSNLSSPCFSALE
jgi:hypothetical protein